MTPYQALNTLTRRQFECLVLASVGMTNAAISRRLGVSIDTIRNRLETVYTRFGIYDTTNPRTIAAVQILPALLELTQSLDKIPKTIAVQRWRIYFDDER